MWHFAASRPFPERLTGLAGREGKHHDVVKGPAVVGMRRVEGQLLAGFPPQVQEEGAVHHGNGEAAEPLPLPDWLVVRGSLVVALRVGKEALNQGCEPTCGRKCGKTAMGTMARRAKQQPCVCFNNCTLDHQCCNVITFSGGHLRYCSQKKTNFFWLLPPDLSH